MKQVDLVCEVCGKHFSVRPSFAKNRRFCSMDCRRASTAHTHKTVQCAQCGKDFEIYVKYPFRYCSPSCATTARNLTDQNPSYHRDISGDKNPMYGRGMSGSDNPMHGKRREQVPAWRGGRKVRKDGYVLVIAPEGHPHGISAGLKSSTKYILEHRLIMEQHLGRYLEPSEVIHHVDGNPSNNSIDNLRLHSNQSAHIKTEHHHR